MVYAAVQLVRLYIMKGLLEFPALLFLKSVIVPIVLTVSLSLPIPYFIRTSMESSFLRLCTTCFISIISVGVASYFCGLTQAERQVVLDRVASKIIK